MIDMLQAVGKFCIENNLEKRDVVFLIRWIRVEQKRKTSRYIGIGNI